MIRWWLYDASETIEVPVEIEVMDYDADYGSFWLLVHMPDGNEVEAVDCMSARELDRVEVEVRERAREYRRRA